MSAATSHPAAARPASRTPLWIAWGLVLLALMAGATTITLYVINRQTIVPPSWNAAGGAREGAIYWLNILAGIAQGVLAASLGALVIVRQPRNRVGWILLWTGFVGSIVTLLDELTIYAAFSADPPMPVSGVLAWVQNWIWVVLIASVLLLLALFPSGRFLSRRWTWLVGLPIILFVMPGGIGSAIEPQLSSGYQLANPIRAAASLTLYSLLFTLAVPMMPLALVAALAQMAARYRAGSVIERQQIKWLLVGISAMLFAVVAGLLLTFAADLLVGAILVNASIIFPLLGIGVGMLRYRLFDVDLIIRRTVVYGLVTGMLALIYFGSVVALQAIAQRLTGRAGDSPLIIVASTLLIAALFTPLRRRLQGAIDRRFYRSKYDAARTLAAFAQSARDEVELEALAGELVRVVEETLQPESASLWLKSR